MKKKLEAELISIAHRVLKLKNRSELDQLQQETLKLYEKISVLRFVEDNFSDVKPTIGYASAEGKLEEIYDTEFSQGEEDKASEEDKEVKDKDDKPAPDTVESEKKDEEESEKDDEPKADKAEVNEAEEKSESEGTAEPEEDIEEYEASDKEEDITEEETDKEVDDENENEKQVTSEDEEKEEAEEDQGERAAGNNNVDENNEDEDEKEQEEPEIKIEVEKPQEDVRAMEESAKAVYKKEQESSVEEEAQASDAEMITIEPDKETKIEKSDIGFEFAFERKPVPEEPKKPQREISFEDFHDYKEPEFIKKDSDAPKATPKDDWQNWEPKKDEAEKPAESIKDEKRETAKQEIKQEQKSLNDTLGKSINLGLNDRIAFEKHLFGGSGEDLNRVLSQLNTMDTFQEAKNFVEDLVKPDYNNWKGKEEFEERFMGLVEKKFD